MNQRTTCSNCEPEATVCLQGDLTLLTGQMTSPEMISETTLDTDLYDHKQ